MASCHCTNVINAVFVSSRTSVKALEDKPSWNSTVDINTGLGTVDSVAANCPPGANMPCRFVNNCTIFGQLWNTLTPISRSMDASAMPCSVCGRLMSKI